MEKLDVEYLQKLAYDRSKTWSSFFESYENNETIARLGDLKSFIDISAVDQVFTPASEDELSDDLLSMEDEDCNDNVKAEFLKSASNTLQFSLLIGNTAVDLSALTSNEEEKQYVDVFNKTLPILNEHQRQLQEFGFDKVLLSFKKDEIENKFGGWLNRHNSLFGGDNTLIYHSRPKCLGNGKSVATNVKPIKAKPCFSKEETDNDSDASLQSGETARYIRSSRIGTVKNSTNTMIKTFRMVRKTRDALHEKYGCEIDEEDYRCNGLRVCKKHGNMQYHDYYRTPRKNEGVSSRSQRRKVLRKRMTSNNCNINTSSSDSESCESYRKSQRRNIKFCCSKHSRTINNLYNTPLTARNGNGRIFKTRSAMRVLSALKNRLYYFSRSMSYSSSSPSTSFNTATEKRRNIKRKSKLEYDERLYKLESECCCYNANELCKQFKHVADTSTEEWYVDSGCTPEKQFKTPMTKNFKQSKSCQSEVLQPNTEKRESNAKTNLKKNNYKSKTEQQQVTFTSESHNSEVKVPTNQQTKTLKAKIKTRTSCHSEKLPPVTRKKKNDVKSIKSKKNSKENKHRSISKQMLGSSTDSSDAELKMAILASKEEYDREQKKKEELVTKKDCKIKSTKTMKNEEENVAEKTAINTKTLSQKTESVTVQPTTAKKSSEETFFASVQGTSICNSTALSSGGQAFKRQLADKKQTVEDDDTESSDNVTVINLTRYKPKPKSAKKKLTSTKISEARHIENGATNFKVTSTTVRSPELNFSSLSQNEENKQLERTDGKVSDDQKECYHVTSTTNIETPASGPREKETEKTLQKNLSANRHEDLSRNCVLIYAPEYQSVAEANNSFRNGYFTVTQEHLSTLIGENAAMKFLKYYTGRKRFRLDSRVYYKPPVNLSSSSSESSDDLDRLGQYGGDLIAITK